MHGGNMAENLLSLDPGDAIHVSFLDNVDGTIVDAAAVIFQDDNYNNGEAVVGFTISVDTEDGHDPITKFLKMGSKQMIAPNEDRTGFKSVSDKFRGFNDKVAGMYFLASLINNQYPSPVGADIKKALVGLRAHFETEEVVSNNKAIGKDGKFGYTIVTKIYELPEHLQGNGKKKSANGKKAQTSSKTDTTTSSASSPDDLITKAQECLTRYLSDMKTYPDGILKSKLASIVVKDPELKDDPDQMRLSVMIFRDTVLQAENMPYIFDAEANTVRLRTE